MLSEIKFENHCIVLPPLIGLFIKSELQILSVSSIVVFRVICFFFCLNNYVEVFQIIHSRFF